MRAEDGYLIIRNRKEAHHSGVLLFYGIIDENMQHFSASPYCSDEWALPYSKTDMFPILAHLSTYSSM